MRQQVTEILPIKDEEIITIPHNIEAEQALLGAILLNNDLLDRVADTLEPGHFYDPLHGEIFRRIIQVSSKGRAANPITLKDFFADEAPLGSITVSQYLGKLVASTVSLDVRSYAETILNLSHRRNLILIGEDIRDAALEGHSDLTPKELIEDAEAKLFEIAETGNVSGPTHVSHALKLSYESAKAAYYNNGVVGISTGISSIDKRMGGLKNSDLIILAARPAMGKTALICNITKNTTMENIPAGFFSLEMSKDQLATRWISDFTGISSSDIKEGHTTEQQLKEVEEAYQFLSDLPLVIDDTGGLSIASLSQRARRMKRKHGIKLLVVDYLQLMCGVRSHGNRTQEITEITTGLKALAKELNIPIIALSQLSRNVESRDDKRPQLSDLRESGSIEQDADIVLFLYREEYYLAKEEPGQDNIDKYVDWQAKMSKCCNKAEIIIGKHRHGSTGKINLHFDAKTTKFSDLSGRA